MTASYCRACNAPALSLVLDLGLMPPSRRFLSHETARQPEPIHPLRLLRCNQCGLLQSGDSPPLDKSSLPLPASQAAADRLLARHRLRTGDVLFVHDALVSSLDPHSVLKDVSTRMPDGGAAVLDIPNLLQLYDELSCDFLGHETRCCFSVTLLADIAARHGLEIVDIERDTESPGLLRVLMQRPGGKLASRPSVGVTIARERAADLDKPGPWSDFAVLVEQGRDMLNSELEEWQYRNRPIAAYSCGGRGMTLLAYCGNAPLRLPYLVDESPALHGMLTPGHRIPIVGPDRLLTERPEAVLLLGRGWNPEADGPLQDYWRTGGRILLPLPKPHYAEPHAAADLERVSAMSFSEFA